MYIITYGNKENVQVHFRKTTSECNKLAKTFGKGFDIKQRKYIEFYHKSKNGEEVLMIKQLEKENIDEMKNVLK